MLVAEDKEMNSYKDRINQIWLISKKEGLAKGLMFGGVRFFFILNVLIKNLVSIYWIYVSYNNFILWQ